MKLLTFVLNQTEKLDELLTEFAHMGIGGGTIFRVPAWPGCWVGTTMRRTSRF